MLSGKYEQRVKDLEKQVEKARKSREKVTDKLQAEKDKFYKDYQLKMLEAEEELQRRKDELTKLKLSIQATK
jgi:hypothetical protein